MNSNDWIVDSLIFCGKCVMLNDKVHNLLQNRIFLAVFFGLCFVSEMRICAVFWFVVACLNYHMYC